MSMMFFLAVVGLAVVTPLLQQFTEDQTSISFYMNQLKSVSQAKATLLIIFIVLIIYNLFEFLKKPPKQTPEKFYAKRVTLDEYEMQSKTYTQQKLSELYCSKEYQNYVRLKSNKPKSDFPIEEESEDDI